MFEDEVSRHFPRICSMITALDILSTEIRVLGWFVGLNMGISTFDTCSNLEVLTKHQT